MKHLLMSLFIMWLPFSIASASGGSWSQKSAGGTLSVGKELLTGRPLHAPQTIVAGTQVKRIAWKITLLSPPPAGLEIKLCQQGWCILLPSLAGSLTPDRHLHPEGTFRFIYYVNHLGQLHPPLTVVSNQLTLEYGQVID